MSASLGLWRLYRTTPFPKIQVLSGASPEERSESLSAAADYDVLVVAGGLGPLKEGIEALAKTGKQCVYVLSEADMQGYELASVVDEARSLSKGTCVYVLERDAIVIDGVRFLGATLWSSFDSWRTDFVVEFTERPGQLEGITTEQWWQDVSNRVAAAELCRCAGHPLITEASAREAIAVHPVVAFVEHRKTIRWLDEELGRQFDGPTVVVSSHAPARSVLNTLKAYQAEYVAEVDWQVHEHKRNSVRLYALSNDNRALLSRHRAQIDLWIHGGVPANSDFIEQGVRVICRNGPRPKQNEEPFGVTVLNSIFAKSRKSGRRKAPANEVREEPKQVAHPAAIDLEQGFVEPLAAFLRPIAESMEKHGMAIRNALPHLMAKSSMHRACVRRVIHEELWAVNRLSRAVAEVENQLTPPDRFFLYGKDYASDSPEGYPSQVSDAYRFDYYERADSVAQRITSISTIPREATVALNRWCDLAAALLGALHDRGVEASVIRPPYEALRRAEGAMRLTVTIADEKVDCSALRKSVTDELALLDFSQVRLRILHANELDIPNSRLLDRERMREVVENIVVAVERVL